MDTHRRTLTTFLALALIACATLLARGADKSDPADNIATLISPQKLATLGKRGANPRVQKAVYWIETARRDGQDITNVVTLAVARAGYTNALAAQLTRDALLRNLKIADGYQCLDADGLSEMRQGKSPTIQRGNYKGDQLSVDHIIPRAVCPELDNVIANLELMPMRRNASKNDRVEARQVQKAQALSRAGLLSPAGLASVQKAAR